MSAECTCGLLIYILVSLIAVDICDSSQSFCIFSLRIDVNVICERCVL